MSLDDQDQHQRQDDRPDDREDDTDRAIKMAREHVLEAVSIILSVMFNETASHDERVRAATTVLEVAGCL